ncbi:MAG: hypothetical protein WCO35_02420 [Candidatus Nomurabacteria bacterium]
MVLPDEKVIEFQDLYKSNFGIEINKEEAYEKGIKLFNLLSLIYKPISEKEKKEINEKRFQTIKNKK